MSIVLLPEHRWQEVRHLFPEKERAALNLAAVGESVSPRGVYIDEAKLTIELRGKILFHFEQRTARGGAS
jgi:hypothetical protein